ncbi:hypothetical protein GHT06_014420 [Daphnia sinensis]|uniref:Uncharacterized protein n=1 Tax=Daphnia sinensis TaxID=1820382 RepID=A0AAD5LMA8_9CRUS|nr:hypothetical protein GHT06_014420 [Daphnia sinensis]
MRPSVRAIILPVRKNAQSTTTTKITWKRLFDVFLTIAAVLIATVAANSAYPKPAYPSYSKSYDYVGSVSPVRLQSRWSAVSLSRRGYVILGSSVTGRWSPVVPHTVQPKSL